MSLTTKISLQVSAILASALDLVTSSAPLKLDQSYTLTSGTGANQASNVFSDTRTLAASGSESLDLAGVLTNAFGAVLTFTKIKAIIITAEATNTNDVVVGGAATNAFASMFGAATDKIKVKPGGAFAIVAPDVNGFAVTAGTGDLLQIANSGAGTGVTYDIIIIGVE